MRRLPRPPRGWPATRYADVPEVLYAHGGGGGAAVSNRRYPESDMIERVEKAILDAYEASDLPREWARAAIEEMRTPTEAMIDAAPEAWRTPTLGWAKMIDEALK